MWKQNKEASAIVWEIEHFHLYLFGAECIRVTNHKPLEIIFSKPRSNSLPELKD